MQAVAVDHLTVARAPLTLLERVDHATAVDERVALYEHAARVTSEPDRKIHLLEKVAWLKDDVAGDPADVDVAMTAGFGI